MGYQWTCPVCGKSKTNQSGGESEGRNAINALRAHIAASDGDGHGPRHAFPDADALELSEHVVRDDDRTDLAESGWR